MTSSTFSAAVPGTASRSGAALDAVRWWLRVVAACIILMVLVGGATRLTESGLSITEWAPLFGAVPPLTAAAWEAKFAAYKEIPQFALHADMTLGEFKTIFFWEWTHRLIGRVLGLLIALPLALFWIAGRLPAPLKLRAVGLLLLVGLQGAVGWWMVKSGLTERTEVSQYRLATHLLLATATLAYVVWLERSLAPPRPDRLGPKADAAARWGSVLVVLVFGQIGLGALVAGLRAGLVFNTWPAMDGGIAPPWSALTFLHPFWRNLFENPAAVQLEHRTVAYLVLAAAVLQAVQLRRMAPRSRAARRTAIFAALVLGQAAIGIATLVLVVPLAVALCHQALAMAVLVMAVVHRAELRGSPARSPEGMPAV